MRKNIGGPEFRIQNQFTKYLHTSLIRERNRYINEKIRIVNGEIPISSFQQEETVGYDALLALMASYEGFEAGLHSALELSDSLNKLPEEAKEIIYRHIYLGQSFGEIASELGLKISKVHNSYYRSLLRLRQEWNNE